VKKFLYIDPLKQGLKPIKDYPVSLGRLLFLYIDPLKQGLKPIAMTIKCQRKNGFYT